MANGGSGVYSNLNNNSGSNSSSKPGYWNIISSSTYNAWRMIRELDGIASVRVGV